MNRRAVAIGVAVAALAANIVFQYFLVRGVPGGVLIPGFADLRPAWNRGVSFSLFVQDTALGWHLLVALLLVISAVVAAAMWRTTTDLAATGFALVLGGALGNVLDRVRYDGAVFDFLALHVGTMPLFVCNLADIFISAGAVLVVLDSLLAKPDGARDLAA